MAMSLGWYSKSLVLPFALAMLTLFSGRALYPLLFNEHITSILGYQCPTLYSQPLPYVYLYWK